MRKKPWRKILPQSHKPNIIRSVCFSILILELAFFTREALDGSLVFVERGEEAWLEEREAGEEADENGHEKTYGFKIRLEDGQIDVYRKEELKNTH